MLSHSSLLWPELLVESGAEENMVELLTAFIIGAIIGWLARQLVPGTRLDLLGDALVGIAGALIGSLLFPRLHLHVGGGIVASIIAVIPAAIGGAVIIRSLAKAAKRC